ncbi:MAG: DNA polymerase III subunit delta' [Epsilonproteobacteria bacterium]|nr:MAG: DNA polymerase III subunit delta' [Campylobacterota bacterium]
MIDSSIIFIVTNIDDTLNSLLPTLPKHDTRIIRNEEDGKTEFLISHAQKAIKESYLASSNTKYIILCGSIFRVEAQNSLLKVLEEPPKNIVFIIITQSKSSILPTIFSRIPHKFMKEKVIIDEFPLDLVKLDLQQILDFLKENQRINKNETKQLIESILYKVQQQNIILNEKQLNNFSKSIKLINLNSRPINVLTHILLSLLED